MKPLQNNCISHYMLSLFTLVKPEL
jgi:hypothetical protein